MPQAFPQANLTEPADVGMPSECLGSRSVKTECLGRSPGIEILSKLQTRTTKKRIITFSTKLLSRIFKIFDLGFFKNAKWVFRKTITIQKFANLKKKKRNICYKTRWPLYTFQITKRYLYFWCFYSTIL